LAHRISYRRNCFTTGCSGCIVCYKGAWLTPRLVALIEGESLINDASGLIAYKYAIAAVAAGSFFSGTRD
jgi:hypothetical protein